MKYRIKQAYPIYWLDRNTVRIGAQEGITTQFRDPDGQLRSLLAAMDGTRSEGEVVDYVIEQAPTLAPSDVLSGINVLLDRGLLENAATPAAEGRFEVNQRFFSAARSDPNTLDPHATLRSASIALLGLGGGGSAVLPQLIALGYGRVVGVDQDIVEEGNLNRQFLFDEEMIGQTKSEGAARVVARMSSHTRFEAHHARLDSADGIYEVLKDVDVAICALDDPPFVIHRMVNAAALRAEIPTVYMLSQVTRGRVFSIRPKVDACVDCLHVYYSAQDPNFFRQFDALMQTSTPGMTAAIAPHIMRLTSFAADESVRLLTNYAEPLTCQTQFEVDYIRGTAGPLLTWDRSDECPTCGTGNESEFDSLAHYPIYEGR